VSLFDFIKDRCVIEGDCWNWQGALQSCGSTPTINVRNPVTGKRSVMSVRRAALLEKHKDSPNLLKGKLATYSCGNAACVNPEHTHAVGRKALQKRIVQELGYLQNPVRGQKIAKIMRAKSQLTPELVAQIRADDAPQKQTAARFGVSQATISKIKRWETWKDTSNPFAQLGARL
jgi:predicted XRE-type DNA-binding protein